MLALLLPLLPSTASAKEYTLTRLLNQVTAGETITVGADWIEPTSTDFSVGLVLTNEVSDRALAIRKDEVRCSRGETTGQAKAGTGGLALAPGATTTLKVVCLVSDSATGPYTVELLKVYDDPEQLGQATEAVLFEGLEWKVPEPAIEKKAQKVPAGFVPAVTDHPVPPPAGPLGVAPEKTSALAALGTKVLDAVQGDGEKPPFEVTSKEYKLARAKNQVVVGETLTIGADALHPQSDHYVVWLALVNRTDQGVVIPRKEMACFRGETQGTLDHAAFGVGKDTLPLAAGETKLLTMTCPVAMTATGPFGVSIAHVYADPNGTGVVSGKAVLENARWTIEEAALDPAVQ